MCLIKKSVVRACTQKKTTFVSMISNTIKADDRYTKEREDEACVKHRRVLFMTRKPKDAAYAMSSKMNAVILTLSHVQYEKGAQS